jgi:hypothetical protein
VFVQSNKYRKGFLANDNKCGLFLSFFTSILNSKDKKASTQIDALN